MAAPIKIDDEEGWLNMTIRTDTGDVPARLDIVEANNTFVALCGEHADEQARGDAWVEWLSKKGLPKLNHGAALGVATEVTRRAKEFATKYGLNPNGTPQPAA